jgi:GLPGLI family protein
MKYYISILIAILIIGNNYSQNNNFIATYKINYTMVNYDSILNTMKEKSKGFMEMVKKDIIETKASIKELGKINFILKYNKDASIYHQQKTIFVNERGMRKLFPLLNIKDDREIYTNKDKIHVNLNAFGENFNLEIGRVKWQITNETKKIGKFNCYKAIGLFERSSYINKKDEKIIAWFTPEIPFNFGPKYYSGLPGLIIKLEEGRVSYALKKINKAESQKINFQKKGKQITAEKLRIMAGGMLKNRYN